MRLLGDNPGEALSQDEVAHAVSEAISEVAAVATASAESVGVEGDTVKSVLHEWGFSEETLGEMCGGDAALDCSDESGSGFRDTLSTLSGDESFEEWERRNSGHRLPMDSNPNL